MVTAIPFVALHGPRASTAHTTPPRSGAMNQISTSSQVETSDSESRELSISELDTVAGGDIYVHNPRGTSERPAFRRD
jgi:hypothetical protein